MLRNIYARIAANNLYDLAGFEVPTYMLRFQNYWQSLFILIVIFWLTIPVLSMTYGIGPIVEKVQELRSLNVKPTKWQGGYLDIDVNYRIFEKWFSDNLGMRDLMIRTKNELDYRLFGTSSRVYFGKDDHLFLRTITDFELPATEQVLESTADQDAVIAGITEFTRLLQEEGIKPIYVFPLMKHYFYRDKLPIFAPDYTYNSNFHQLYQRLISNKEFQVVDVETLMRKHAGNFPLYYRQDFHWTSPAAFIVASQIVDTIASNEGWHSSMWSHSLAFEFKPFLGTDARFSARLITHPLLEPSLNQTWTDHLAYRRYDPSLSKIEFEAESPDDSSLLPPTCMYGNSYSDEFLQAGMPIYFKRFVKLNRQDSLNIIRQVGKDRCKYAIIQILDIQTQHWIFFRDLGRQIILN